MGLEQHISGGTDTHRICTYRHDGSVVAPHYISDYRHSECKRMVENRELPGSGISTLSGAAISLRFCIWAVFVLLGEGEETSQCRYPLVQPLLTLHVSGSI